MHPDLAELLANYNRVVDDYEAGNLTEEAAFSALSALQVVDGDGYEWSIDATTGQLTRARPGEPPTPADPAEFAPPRIYTSDDPWTSPPAFTRPPLPDDAPPPPPGAPTYPPSGRTLPETGVPPARTFGFLSDLWNTRRRLVLLVAAGIVVVAGFLFAGKPSPSDDIAPTTIPGVTVPIGTDITTATTVRTTVTTSATTSTSTTAAAVVPTSEEMAEVLTALSSGDRQTVASVVAVDPDPTTLALRTAQYAGYAATGLLLQPRAAVAADGKILAAVDLIDVESGETLRQATAAWVPSDTGWLLSAFLDF